jgi:WD40 repeat protein
MGHTLTVNSLSQFENNTFISGSWDGTAKIWDVSTGKVLHTLSDHSYAVTTLAVSTTRYITASQDKKIRFWDKGQCYKVIEKAHEGINLHS